MLIVQSYGLAVALCVVTMLCWGSWANTQKLASKEWRFQLFYWDYAIGVLLFALVLAFTAGSTGDGGPQLPGGPRSGGDAERCSRRSSGGVVFNLSNILLVAAIDIAGHGGGVPDRRGARARARRDHQLHGDAGRQPRAPVLRRGGVVLAILFSAAAYRRLPVEGPKTTGKGIALSVVAGLLMGYFYRFVAASMSTDFAQPGAGQARAVHRDRDLLARAAAVELRLEHDRDGEAVRRRAGALRRLLQQGNGPRLHLVGILGGMIWNLGMSLSIVASGVAGFAISYGLGQGATLVAALWGVFIWKEFRGAPAGTNRLLTLMFASFIVGPDADRVAARRLRLGDVRIDRRRRQPEHGLRRAGRAAAAAGRDGPRRRLPHDPGRQGREPGVRRRPVSADACGWSAASGTTCSASSCGTSLRGGRRRRLRRALDDATPSGVALILVRRARREPDRRRGRSQRPAHAGGRGDARSATSTAGTCCSSSRRRSRRWPRRRRSDDGGA